MANLYFNNAVNTDMDEEGNWWTDSGCKTGTLGNGTIIITVE